MYFDFYSWTKCFNCWNKWHFWWCAHTNLQLLNKTKFVFLLKKTSKICGLWECLTGSQHSKMCKMLIRSFHRSCCGSSTYLNNLMLKCLSYSYSTQKHPFNTFLSHLWQWQHCIFSLPPQYCITTDLLLHFLNHFF